MNAPAFVADMRARGVTVTLDGDRLRLRGPQSEHRPEVAAYIRQHKADLVEFLRAADPPMPRRPRRTATEPGRPNTPADTPNAPASPQESGQATPAGDLATAAGAEPGESHPAVKAWACFDPTRQHSAEEWAEWFAVCKQHGVPAGGVYDAYRARRRHEAAAARLKTSD